MSFIARFFGRRAPGDDEQILEKLVLDIQKRETRLSEIRLRERRSTLLFSIYAIALWAAYGSLWLWYTDLLPNLSGHHRNSKFEKAVKAFPVFVGPIVILFVRRIVQIWYTRTGDTEEKALVALRKRRRDKIEEIKKKTNYYSTRNLIERYDDGSASGVSGSPQTMRRRIPSQAPPVTPQRPQQHLNVQTPMPPPASPNSQQYLSPSPQRPLPPPRKQWYDKLADAILGDDGETATGAASRYALICHKCFTHNGLVKESVWEDTQYVCPKCGHFNPSARAVRQARGGSKSPPKTPTPLPQPDLLHPFASPVGRSVNANGAVENHVEGKPGDEDGPVEGASTHMDVDS
ncbi:hypothetical protein BKA93DRAFT_900240 [Sparassis latifolia]